MRSNFPSRQRHNLAGPTDASVRWSAARPGANVRFRPKAVIHVAIAEAADPVRITDDCLCNSKADIDS